MIALIKLKQLFIFIFVKLSNSLSELKEEDMPMV